MFMFGAKKVRPAWPLFANALASVDITVPISLIKLLECYKGGE